MLSQMQQQQQQNLLQPNQLNTSQQSVMQTSSAMQPSTMQSILSSLQQNQQYNSTCHGSRLLTEISDTASELQGEALVHKTYAARLMGGEASAPAAATSVLQFMVDPAKISPFCCCL
ncbi:hypothetical protein KIW84_074542 [Lathyrus oleraceus]|uniref:Uncharacterized protein n=1 Tax=Pisum sativum TaxID=3888 RepID=A0A9D4VUE2_PEA|nr:hypothetical protein KIW84_074542 [Pisum sativum]